MPPKLSEPCEILQNLERIFGPALRPDKHLHAGIRCRHEWNQVRRRRSCPAHASASASWFFWKVYSREPVCGVISYDIIDGSFEYRLDGSPGPVMHPIAQLEVTQRKARIVNVVIKSVELWFVEPVMLFYFGVESLERLKIEPLVRVIKRLTEVKVFQFLCVNGTRTPVRRPAGARARLMVPDA